MSAYRPNPRSSFLPSILIACALGCGRTTPVGPLGDPVAFRPFLPAGVTPPPEKEATLHRARAFVEEHPPEPPAEVQVEWRTFKQGPKAYLLSATVTVERSASGL